MDDFSIADEITVANRDEPLPVITIAPTDDTAPISDGSEEEEAHRQLDRTFSGSTSILGEKAQNENAGKDGAKPSLQEKLLSKYASFLSRILLLC